MPTLHRVVLLSLAAVLWAAPANARVVVTFLNQDTYSDPDLHGLPVRAELKAYLERLGSRYLGRNADLKISVLDLRLAGIYASWNTPPSYRVMRESTWPAMTVRYVLTQGGRTVTSGEETVSDQFYLTRS